MPHPQPIPFSNIPIIGLPYDLKAFTGPQVAIVCNCEAKPVLLINGLNHVVQCPGCKRGRTVLAFSYDKATGQFAAEVAEVAVEVKP